MPASVFDRRFEAHPIPVDPRDLSIAVQLLAIKRTFAPVAARINVAFETRKAALGLSSLTSREAIGSEASIQAYRRKLVELAELTAEYKKNIEILVVETSRQSLAVLVQLPPESQADASQQFQQYLQMQVSEVGLYFDSMQRWIAAVSDFFDQVEPHCQGFVFEPGNTFFPSQELLARCRPLMAQIQHAHEQQRQLFEVRRRRLAGDG